MISALDEFERVERRKKHAHARRNRQAEVAGVIGPHEHQELSDKIAEAGQAHGAHGEKHRDAAQARNGGPQASQPIHLARVGAFLELANQHEERPGADAVSDHADQGAFERPVVSGVDPEQDKTQVADAGVSDQALQVGLREGHHRAVNDARHGERHGGGRKVARRLREERQHEAQQPVRSGL